MKSNNQLSSYFLEYPCGHFGFKSVIVFDLVPFLHVIVFSKAVVMESSPAERSAS